MATDAFRLAHGHDMRGGRYVVRAHVARPVPDDLVHLAASVARSLHRALDELAKSLADAPVNFPIYESLVLFAQRSRKAIARMPDESQATIEALRSLRRKDEIFKTRGIRSAMASADGKGDQP